MFSILRQWSPDPGVHPRPQSNMLLSFGPLWEGPRSEPALFCTSSRHYQDTTDTNDDTRAEAEHPPLPRERTAVPPGTKRPQGERGETSYGGETPGRIQIIERGKEHTLSDRLNENGGAAGRQPAPHSTPPPYSGRELGRPSERGSRARRNTLQTAGGSRRWTP